MRSSLRWRFGGKSGSWGATLQMVGLAGWATREKGRLYGGGECSYTFSVMLTLKIARALAILCLGFGAGAALGAQETGGAAAGKPAEATAAPVKTAEKAELPFQISLLETRIRFEANGDSRKEVHTVVKINDLLGARQFARLGFDYNRGYQQVEIPMVRVTHANGGTLEVLPSAVTDAPNPAVEKYPAYQDVRVKSVRILGLQEGDTVEYRVVTTTTKQPLAPDYWLEHTFDRSGQVQAELYVLDLPGHLNSTTQMKGRWSGSTPEVYLAIPCTTFENSGEGKGERSIFEWKLDTSRKLPDSAVEKGVALPDLLVSTFFDWDRLSWQIASKQPKWGGEDQKTAEVKLLGPSTKGTPTGTSLKALYQFVSNKITTVDLPTGANGYRSRSAKQIMESGYGTSFEKCLLLAQLANWKGDKGEVLLSATTDMQYQIPRPSALDHVFVGATQEEKYIALDPSLEVAPFGMIAPQFRGKNALSLTPHDYGDYSEALVQIPEKLPFRSVQKVGVNATVGEDGKLTANVKYTLRGDNELLLRVAFHKTAKEKWKDVAGLLALADGFRGVITSATASDPMATKEPFIVEYELTQAKFVDWAKKPVRIPALLPLIGLPDSTTKSARGGIELGTPLDVETQGTLHLPGGTTVQTPAGTAVKRDYATYSSKYRSTADTLTAYRRIHFLEREVAAARGVDYGAFVQAVQNDQAQFFVLESAAKSMPVK